MWSRVDRWSRKKGTRRAGLVGKRLGAERDAGGWAGGGGASDGAMAVGERGSWPERSRSSGVCVKKRSGGSSRSKREGTGWQRAMYWLGEPAASASAAVAVAVAETDRELEPRAHLQYVLWRCLSYLATARFDSRGVCLCVPVYMYGRASQEDSVATTERRNGCASGSLADPST